MMYFLIGFILFFIICFYLFIFSLCWIAKRSDEQAEKLFNELRKGDKNGKYKDRYTNSAMDH